MKKNLNLLFENISIVTVIKLNVDGSKICYQCDQKHPSSWWKFWGEKITRCHGIPFGKYATKTSKAFGTAVLTCYTVIFLIQLSLSQLNITSSHRVQCRAEVTRCKSLFIDRRETRYSCYSHSKRNNSIIFIMEILTQSMISVTVCGGENFYPHTLQHSF